MEYVKAHDRPPVAFKDILKERHESSDMLWVSREITTTKAYKNTPGLKHLQEVVLNSPRIQSLIDNEAKEKNLKREVVNITVKNVLNEIACSKDIPVVRWLGYILLKIMKRIVSALFVNETQLLKLKETMGSNPVLLLPSHRSYADFILMAFVMFNYDIDLPCVAAGMDFHSMWLMGRLLRDCSAFFMRRSFSDDKLYKTVFDEYVKTLLRRGDAPVEFFIEGTRSRSAKALMPKFGLLTMVMDTFYSGDVPDITIVPVNISYDRSLEEVLFAYEMLGIAKPKESTSGLIKGINMLDERYGSVYVNFGEPISAHQFVWQMSAGEVNYTTRQMAREQYEVAYLAHSVIDRLQKHTVVSCFNLLALVLSNHISTSVTPLSLARAAADVTWLSSILSVSGAYVVQLDGDPLVAVKEAINVHKSLVIINDDVIQLVAVHSPNYSIDPSRVKGYNLGGSTMTEAVPLLMLQQYVNPCLHFLVSPAIITVIMQRLGGSGQISKDKLFTKYQYLRALLSQEFVLYKEWEAKEFDDALSKLELVNIIESSTDVQLTLGNHKKLQLMMCNLLYPFLSCYLSLGRYLLQLSPEAISERAVLQGCQGQMEKELVTGVIHSPVSLSLDTLTCALSGLTNIQALTRCRRNGDVEYKVIHQTLLDIINQLSALVVRPQELADSIQLDNYFQLDPTVTRAKL